MNEVTTSGGVGHRKEAQSVLGGRQSVAKNDFKNNGVGNLATFADMVNLCYFFFQAEDGIRDRTVTGVQTCALPISDYSAAINWGDGQSSAGAITVNGAVFSVTGHHTYAAGGADVIIVTLNHDSAPQAKIGRASCRERV